jgi:hypothetical protein
LRAGEISVRNTPPRKPHADRGAMQAKKLQSDALIDKIRSLPPEKIAEVEDFVDFLRAKNADDGLVRAAGKLAEPSLAKIWDNEDDAEYDRL